MRPSPSMRRIYEVLKEAIPDPGKWWPAQSRFEILVGAILTQNTTWTSVEKAIENLKAADLLHPDALGDAREETIHSLIKPSGYWRAKTRYLQALTLWFQNNDASSAAMSRQALRESLLGVHGVGEETADDILLYAYGHGVFIYDAYARRLLQAAGWGDYRTYSQARRACEERILDEHFTVEEFAHLHGLIVQAGKNERRGLPTGFDLVRHL